jgi:hypothetical protein
VNILSSQLFQPNLYDVIVQLVRRRFEGPQEALAQAYSRTFANTTGSDKAQLTQHRGNVELCFKDNIIQICNCNRWNEMSMTPRVEFRKPPNTNTHECTHGHFNKAIHRRRTFRALYRIAVVTVGEVMKSRSILSHNFDRTVRPLQPPRPTVNAGNQDICRRCIV